MTELSNTLESNLDRNSRNKSKQKLNQYDDAIKDTIGLRLQERLTKKQAKIVSSCKAIHRDISLNF